MKALIAETAGNLQHRIHLAHADEEATFPACIDKMVSHALKDRLVEKWDTTDDGLQLKMPHSLFIPLLEQGGFSVGANKVLIEKALQGKQSEAGNAKVVTFEDEEIAGSERQIHVLDDGKIIWEVLP